MNKNVAFVDETDTDNYDDFKGWQVVKGNKLSKSKDKETGVRKRKEVREAEKKKDQEKREREAKSILESTAVFESTTIYQQFEDIMTNKALKEIERTEKQKKYEKKQKEEIAVNEEPKIEYIQTMQEEPIYVRIPKKKNQKGNTTRFQQKCVRCPKTCFQDFHRRLNSKNVGMAHQI